MLPSGDSQHGSRDGDTVSQDVQELYHRPMAAICTMQLHLRRFLHLKAAGTHHRLQHVARTACKAAPGQSDPRPAAIPPLSLRSDIEASLTGLAKAVASGKALHDPTTDLPPQLSPQQLHELQVKLGWACCCCCGGGGGGGSGWRGSRLAWAAPRLASGALARSPASPACLRDRAPPQPENAPTQP